MKTKVNGCFVVPCQAPTYQLLLVETSTGQVVAAPVAWPPFLQALHSLCTQLRNVELVYEDETDESAALFWLPLADLR